MKLFTNKFFLGLSVCVFIAACSSKEEENQSEPVLEGTILVEEVVLPPTAEKPSPLVQPAAPLQTLPKTSSLTEALVNLKAWDTKLKFLKTNFEQTTEYDGVPVSKSQGALYYDRDKHMLRLDTTDTDGKMEQSAVTDKKQILILDGQGHEITTLSWQEWQQGQPNQALFDFGNYTDLLARHQAVLKEPYVLELTPKEGEKYTLYLTLSETDYFPTTLKIVSDLMVTQAKLLNVQKNQPLALDTFHQGGFFQ